VGGSGLALKWAVVVVLRLLYNNPCVKSFEI
jgi:hypothetical protein